jgi:uncharacterized membrane protein YGL010W
MKTDSKLLEMLTGYAASHQHPVNIAVHMVGIPTIMLGVLIPLSWMTLAIGEFSVTPAFTVVVGFFLFYLTLDVLFAVVFLVFGIALAVLAAWIAALPMAVSGTVAAVAFLGGYTAQFVGHAIEKSMPVLVKHPIQANLAAPFFTVVEMFKMLGLRDELFNEVQRQIALLRK